MKKYALYQAVVLASMHSTLSAPVIAQDEQGAVMDEVLVSARRREERLQDVPASITVLDQEQMTNANIVTAADIATYTPSLQVNSRFGDDSSNFAIRGFSQELRTTASVGVYFAEVIAPRGANTTQSGDGAGPGDFFDLANVQVLKGPQGTLFGRNTTGGAVLITPQKPTDVYEGYLETSAGNFDMQRLQGVVNIPVAETLRIRLGVDQQKRDGYLNNVSGIGPSDFADLDYTSYRLSAVWDITEAVENYTIIKASSSSNNGAPFSVFACNPAVGFGNFCEPDLAARHAAGKDGEYDVYNFLPDPKSDIEQKQIINTTSWQISNDLTLKNILSYALFESHQDMALYGTDWRYPIGNPGGQPILSQMLSANAFPTTDQKTWVEEIQLQGTALDSRLTWQGGVYYEKSKPHGDYGAQNPAMLSCDVNTISSDDLNNWRCNDILAAVQYIALGGNPSDPVPFTIGSAVEAPGGVTYENKAIYAQGTYVFDEHWSLTAGLRYTDDTTRGWTKETIYYFPASIAGGYFAPIRSTTQVRKPEVSSEAPTWVICLDYKPADNTMLYGKYSRGYRQGSVNLASVPGWDTHDPEKVDTYEIGSKTSFGGSFPGSLNVAIFYNDFSDQQIQFGYYQTNGVGSTSILNAGASTIKGVEVDGSIKLTSNLLFTASYSYLDTNVDDLTVPDPNEYPDGILYFSGTSAAEGEPLPYTPENQLVASLNYFLPVDESLGEISTTLTYAYTDEMQAVSRATSPYAVLPSYEIFNFSLNWKNILYSSVDMSMFATNLFDKEYRTVVAGNWNSLGMEVGRPGKPRMYGMRVRYNF